MIETQRSGRDILVVGLSESESARVASALALAGHRTHHAARAVTAASLVATKRVDLVLLDLGGTFADVIAAVEVLRGSGRLRCPLLGINPGLHYGGLAGPLRALGFEGIVAGHASPQELIFRVNRILYADRAAANRVSPRVPVNLPATFDGVEGLRTGTVLNLSETGLFLAAEEILPTNRNVTVRFTLAPEDVPLAIRCRVVWANEGGEGRRYFKGMGLQFLEMRPEVRDALQTFLARALETLEVPAAVERPARGLSRPTAPALTYGTRAYAAARLEEAGATRH